MTTSRRDFIQHSAVTVSMLMLGGLVGKQALAARQTAFGGPSVTLEECISMTPTQMAESSPMIQHSWKYLQTEIGRLVDPSIRRLVKSIYADSTPMLASRLQDAGSRRAVFEELTAKKYTTQNPDDFLPPTPSNLTKASPTIAAPGSGYASHHAYPGGLITHVANNTMITRGIVDAYKDIYGYNVNRDVTIAAQILHDLHKPYVFQWQENASSRTEQPLAGAGEHHVLSAAELLVRKAPAELVVAQLCAHTHPGNAQEETLVVNWIKAAAIIAGVDPVGYGLLEKTSDTLPLPRRQEGFLVHLGDHDFVLSVPTVQWTLPIMRNIAQEKYGMSEVDLNGKPFNSLRNMVYSRISAMRLHNVYALEGVNGVVALMQGVVRKS